MTVCFYMAQYLIMHLNTWFNRKRCRCWNGCYLCSPTHFGASSLWTRIYGLIWFCLLPFLCCGALCFTFVFVQARWLSKIATLAYPVLSAWKHHSYMRHAGIEDMNPWKYVMSVFYHPTRNHSTSAFGLFCTGNPLQQLLGTLWLALIYKACSLALMG